MKSPEDIEKKFLNYLHHQEFEYSGLNLTDIKKMVNEKKILYEHFSDQRKMNRWDSKVVLSPLNISYLPDYISSNKEKFKNWIEG
jgi:hypothetical protein